MKVSENLPSQEDWGGVSGGLGGGGEMPYDCGTWDMSERTVDNSAWFRKQFIPYCRGE